MKRPTCLRLLASVVFAAALPAAGHHSFPAQYDVDKPITLTGKVTKVEWTNPHIFIYADVTDEQGTVAYALLHQGGRDLKAPRK